MILILTRKHLLPRFQHHPIQEIMMQMFHSQHLSINSMQHADTIVFVEKAVETERFDVKELKNRFQQAETLRKIDANQLAELLADRTEQSIN